MVLALSFLRLNELASSTRDDVVAVNNRINELSAIGSILKSAVLAHHRYLMTDEEKYLDEYWGLRGRGEYGPTDTRHILFAQPLRVHIDKLAAFLSAGREERAYVNEITKSLDSGWLYLDQSIDLHQAGQEAASRRALRTYLDTRVNVMRGLLHDAMELERGLMYQKIAAYDADAQARTDHVLRIILFFVVLKIALFSLAFANWIKNKKAELRLAEKAGELTAANTSLQNANEKLAILNKTIQDSQEVQIHAIVDYAPDGLIMLDAAGNILRYNPACQKMFQFAPDEVKGKSVAVLMPDYYADACMDVLQAIKTMQDRDVGEIRRFESMARRKDGVLFPVDLSLSSFKLGEALFFSFFLRDITETKQKESSLRRYMQDLERSNRDLDDFAYIASHDLKEPLRGLFNHAQFLLEDYQNTLDADGVRRLQRLSALAHKMERLVNDLLYYSRLGRAELAVQETDPNNVVVDVAHMMEGILKELHADVSIAAPMPTILCDKPRVTEVFRNLITNAVKYNDKDVKRVEVGYLDDVTSPYGPERGVFYVKDNGIGIEEGYHQEIFRIFRRLNPAKNEADNSSGAGLTFVKKIIERHGGHIWLESQPGKGSTFYFNLGRKEAS